MWCNRPTQRPKRRRRQRSAGCPQGGLWIRRAALQYSALLWRMLSILDIGRRRALIGLLRNAFAYDSVTGRLPANGAVSRQLGDIPRSQGSRGQAESSFVVKEPMEGGFTVFQYYSRTSPSPDRNSSLIICPLVIHTPPSRRLSTIFGGSKAQN